jgi:regulator of nucleoside diphosphate kinase
MNEKRVKEIVAQVIAEAQIEPWRYYHICWWEGKLECRHVRHTTEFHTVFYSAPGSMLADRLTPHQWQLILDRITEFCRTRGITLGSGLARGKGKGRTRRAADRPKITEFDSLRLRALLTSDESTGVPSRTRLEKLRRLLESADTVPPQKIPGDIVTMNSHVRLREDDRDSEMVLSLVFPVDALEDVNRKKMSVSVLTPIGLSILGRQVGYMVEGRIRVDRLLYQPEAAGDFHL